MDVEAAGCGSQPLYEAARYWGMWMYDKAADRDPLALCGTARREGKCDGEAASRDSQP